MKKILFTLLLIAGGFVAQAQDDITIRVVTSNGNKIAVGVNDDSLCFDNVTVAKTTVYGYDHTSGIFSQNGETLQVYSGRGKNGINTFFSLYVTGFYHSNVRNNILGPASFTQDGGQYVIR